MPEALKKSFTDELYSIKNSFYKLMLITFLPLFCFALIAMIFKDGVVRDMPIAVVDNDKSKLSRKVLFDLDASPTMKIKTYKNSTKDAIKLLQKGDVYGVVVIAPNFLKDTYLTKNPKVTVMLNTQYILIGKILTSALNATLMQSIAQVDYVKTLAHTQNPVLSIREIAPIKMQVTPFFNTYQNYFFFLVTALIPSIWQIFIVVATIVVFGSIFKAKREMEVFGTKHLFMQILGRLLPYTAAYMFLGIFYLFYVFKVLGWEFQGSFGVVVFAMFLTVLAYEAVALLFFVTGFDYARALSLGAVYSAPAFAFLGVTFPIYNMNEFALFWRDLLPISHYMQIQISQANYGADIFCELKRLSYISVFLLCFVVVYFRFRSRLLK